MLARSICLHIFHTTCFSLVFTLIVYTLSAPAPAPRVPILIPPLPLPYSRLYLSTVLLPVSVLVSAPVSRKKCKFGCILKNAPYPFSTSSSLSYSVVKAHRLSWLSFLSRVFSCVSLRVFSLYSVPFSHPVRVLIVPPFLARATFLDLHRCFCSYWCSLPYIDFFHHL